MIYGLPTRRILLVVCETMLIVLAVVAAAYIRLGPDNWDQFIQNNGIWKTLLLAVIAQTCLYYADVYDMRLVADRRELIIRTLQALGATCFIVAAVGFWFPSLLMGRGIFVLAVLLVISLVVIWRVTFEWLSGRVRPRERLLLVGTSGAALALAREIYEQRHSLGVEIVGFVDPDPAKVGAPVINPGVIGTIDDIPTIVRDRQVDRVVVSLVDARGKLPMDKLLDMKLDGVTFDHLPSVYEEYTGKIAVENLRPSWLIFSEGFRKSQMLSASKRALDVVAAGAGVVLALPLMLMVAVAVRVTSRGPIFYHQDRVGRQGRVFIVHKFRSMCENAEAETGPVWASKAGDVRVTPIGHILRRTRLDELPQLWNVLKGEMSFVGPRPERPEFVKKLTEKIPYYGQRHVVRPGITGWAQVRYTYGATTEDALHKLQYDLYYIKNFSIALDLYIIFETIKTVVLRRGA